MAAMAEPTQATVPLNCTTCPKKPTFSDVSHLLTHIASKGHLSHYYKLKVKSSNDHDAREVIEQYDQWYSDHNIEQLMSERMQLKEQKRPRRRESAPAPKKQAAKPKRRNTADVVSPVKIEPATEKFSFPPLPNPFASVPVKQELKPTRPRLYLWDTKRPGSWDPIAIDSSPSSSSSIPIVVGRSAPLAKMLTSVAIESDEEELLTEVTTLKGVFWPGMDIFDAATPTTRRRRNQKKGISVVDSLERNALRVEPNEVIFTPFGTMKKSRYITGQIVNDSSPYKLDIPSPEPPKKRKGRKPLAEKDKNATSSQGRQTSVTSFRSLEDLDVISSSSKASSIPTAPTKKRKREFQVLDERPEAVPRPRKQRARQTMPKIPEERSFGYPGGMNVLTSAFQHSPTFDADGSRAGAPLIDLTTTQPPTSFFTDAFGQHYQPALLSMPYYGYGYYGGPSYNANGFMPLPPQHPLQPRKEDVRDALDKVLADNIRKGSDAVEGYDESQSTAATGGSKQTESQETYASYKSLEAANDEDLIEVQRWSSSNRCTSHGQP